MNGSLRVGSRHRYLLPCAALLLVAVSSRTDWPPALSAQDAVAEDAKEIARIRSLFRSAENPEEAETVLREAFGDQAASALRSLDAMKEVDLIVWVGARREDAPALRDRMLLEVARRLEDSGTKATLPLVRDIAATRPLVFAHVPGCRRSVRVPVFNHVRQARRAELGILRRAYESEYASLGPDARVGWLLETSASLDAPRLATALRLMRDEPIEVRRELREKLARSEGPLSDSAGQLLVEVVLIDRIVPEAAELRRLTALPAQRLLVEAARQDDDYRLAILDLGRSHPDVASLAAHLDGERGRLSPRIYLERDGASAASVLARDRSSSMTRTLAAVLSDTEAADAVRRHAALALLHQETPEARAAVATALLSSDLPATLARKLRSALEP